MGKAVANRSMGDSARVVGIKNDDGSWDYFLFSNGAEAAKFREFAAKGGSFKKWLSSKRKS